MLLASCSTCSPYEADRNTFGATTPPKAVSKPLRGTEFVATAVVRWLDRAEVGTLFIAKGSPWENGCVESFNGKLRDELLNRELFLSKEEARWVIDRWRLDYNHHRLHSSLEYQTPAAFAASCVPDQLATLKAMEQSEPSSTRFSHSQWYKNRE